MVRKFVGMILLVWALVSISCTRTAVGSDPWRVAPEGTRSTDQEAAAIQPTTRPPARMPGTPVVSPTPNQPLDLPAPRTEGEEYVIQPNDTLGIIARNFGVDIGSIIAANDITNPDHVEVGQVLIIPPPENLVPGPDFKIIPDSELVFSPGTISFNISATVNQYDGYLNRYREEKDGRRYSGAQIVDRVARENSVNPRLLLAVLEYRSGWLTQANPDEESLEYPMYYFDARRSGLYSQLSWAANNLDRGYYIWRAGGTPSWLLQDDTVVPVAPTINAGTAGVQHLFSLLLGKPEWDIAVSEDGLFATYQELFGYPFDYAVEPLLPPDLEQPVMQLPFEPGVVWSFTGGPHGGWADGSGWAALDFAPPGPGGTCLQSEEWVTAIADGLILRSDIGAVVLDLDGDGLEQTGWTVLYLHVESRDRVQPGTQVKAGDRIGHASCEGGYSPARHLHIARRFNGEWISADGSMPFVMDGWVSSGDGVVYNGFLTKDGVSIEAWAERRTENQISR